MIAIFCGSRDWADPGSVREVMEALTLWGLYMVIEGEQRGADTAARRAAVDIGIQVLPYQADWERLGPRAGPMRNDEMLAALLAGRRYGQPVACVAFHEDPRLGVGTKHMVAASRAAGVPVLAWIGAGVPPAERCPCGRPAEWHPLLLMSGGRLSCEGESVTSGR